MIRKGLLLLTILALSNCTLGVVSDVTDTGVANAAGCIVKAGYTDNTLGVSSSPTAILIDNTGLANLNKSRTAFSQVNIAFFTCRGRDPIAQADNFLNKISKKLFDNVWVYLGQESLYYQCSPSSYTPAQNCDYMRAIISEFKKNGVNVGIASNAETWKDQFGTFCGDLGASLPLYWVPDQDNNPSFAGFKPFGGWQTPAVKVYKWGSSIASCAGVNVDLSYRP
jgi:hypothetical protein